MKKILITDHTFDPLDIEEKILNPLGTLVLAQCKTPEQLLPLVADADAVITQFSPVNAQVIAAMLKAQVIVRYGIGVDNVDLEAARQRGIPVCNIPDYCIHEVADHTLAFILALSRQVVPNCLGIRGGHWGLATSIDSMTTLRERTVGVIGFGRIGREVVHRLLAFRGTVQVFDPGVKASEIESTGAIPATTLEELLASSDIMTIHCPSTAQTRRMLHAGRFARMKPGTILVNLSRGDLIDTQALVAALQTGQLAAAALDVCDPEPIPLNHPLNQMPNVILSSHIASVSPKAIQILRETAAELVAKRLRGEPLPCVVNGVST